MNPYRATDASVIEAHRLCGEAVGDPDFLASVEAFAAVLNRACVLSTTILEGRPLPGAVVLLAQRAKPSGFMVRIDRASPDGLRMLVAAAGTGEVVVRDDGRGGFEVLGIEFEGYAGSIGVRFQFRTFGRVFIVAAQTLVAGELPDHGLLTEEFPPNVREEFRPALALGSFLTAPRLLDLLSSIGATRSGGILVVDPAGSNWGSHLVGPIAEWDFSTRAAELQEEPFQTEFFRQIENPRHPTTAAERQELTAREEVRLANCMRHFGAMSRADGAIVVRPNLALVAFGVRLEGDAPETVVVRNLLVPEGARPFLPCAPGPLGGTRLQGALSFANRNRDTVTFVVSADGPVAMIWFEAEQLQLSRGLEAFL